MHHNNSLQSIIVSVTRFKLRLDIFTNNNGTLSYLIPANFSPNNNITITNNTFSNNYGLNLLYLVTGKFFNSLIDLIYSIYILLGEYNRQYFYCKFCKQSILHIRTGCNSNFPVQQYFLSVIKI